MRVRENLRMIFFDPKKVDELDSALRDDLLNSWNRYISSKKCNGKEL